MHCSVVYANYYRYYCRNNLWQFCTGAILFDDPIILENWDQQQLCCGANLCTQCSTVPDAHRRLQMDVAAPSVLFGRSYMTRARIQDKSGFHTSMALLL